MSDTMDCGFVSTFLWKFSMFSGLFSNLTSNYREINFSRSNVFLFVWTISVLTFFFSSIVFRLIRWPNNSTKCRSKVSSTVQNAFKFKQFNWAICVSVYFAAAIPPAPPIMKQATSKAQGKLDFCRHARGRQMFSTVGFYSCSSCVFTSLKGVYFGDACRICILERYLVRIWRT